VKRISATVLLFFLVAAGNSRADFAPLPEEFFLEGWVGSEDSDGCVPNEYWAKPLVAFRPISVCRDHVNIAVVTSVTHMCQEGLYFVVPASSYLPVNTEGRTFVWNAKDELLSFSFCGAQKKESPGRFTVAVASNDSDPLPFDLASEESCFTGRDSTPLTEGHGAALADARARSASECTDDASECRFTVSTQPSGELWVRVERSERDPETGKCGYLPGDHWTLTYRPEGTFIERHRGL
jgi:hypothetical protein